MDYYKYLMKERKKQIKSLYKKINKNEKMLNNAEFNDIVLFTDVNWNKLIPIYDSYDAKQICDKMMDIISSIRVRNIITIKDTIKLYVYMYYTEDFIDSSVIKNSEISISYSFIKEFLFKYESGEKIVILVDY